MVEETYEIYQRQVFAPAAKAAADAASKLSRALKGLQRAAEQGDVERVAALSGGLPDLVQLADRTVGTLNQSATRFDFDAYLTDGGFHADFSEACRAQTLPLEGQFPTYEIFPLRVRILPERHRAMIGARTVRQLEPVTLAALVRKDIDALTKRAFNASQFLKEVSHAYDVVVALHEKDARAKRGNAAARDGIPVNPREIYTELVPTRVAQGLYTLSMFAYDLGRLQQSGERSVDSRSIEFGSTREGSRALRSFDSAGRETFIGTINFARRPA